MPSYNSYCLIPNAEKSFSISLECEKEINYGGEAGVNAEGSDEFIIKFKVLPDENNRYIKRIEIDKEKVNRARLIVNLLFCSNDTEIKNGRLNILLLQDGRRMHIIDPPNEEIQNIPPCSVRNFRRKSFTITLVMKDEVK